MTTLLMTFVILLGGMLLLVAIAILTGRVLKGSCGGVAGGSCVCTDEGRSGGSCEEGLAPELIQIDVGVVAGRN